MCSNRFARDSRGSGGLITLSPRLSVVITRCRRRRRHIRGDSEAPINPYQKTKKKEKKRRRHTFSGNSQEVNRKMWHIVNGCY